MLNNNKGTKRSHSPLRVHFSRDIDSGVWIQSEPIVKKRKTRNSSNSIRTKGIKKTPSKNVSQRMNIHMYDVYVSY
jgi:hypothetical protein